MMKWNIKKRLMYHEPDTEVRNPLNPISFNQTLPITLGCGRPSLLSFLTSVVNNRKCLHIQICPGNFRSEIIVGDGVHKKLAPTKELDGCTQQ
ncbi:hypothetical protein J6590_012905 [Homalodisca vitripennis]|nr:hypothetical protein J6590_012905 [Homalodisca vitripennis]